ncbi:unnamed protein product [Symbiodinium microadriaticum]|nr:unnamed protein product [Symbiodinium microadriaticum]
MDSTKGETEETETGKIDSTINGDPWSKIEEREWAGHWSSETWSDWSWDRYGTWNRGPWGRSWSHESWSQDDWCKEMRRGSSADLSAQLQASQDGDNEQTQVQAALQRQPTSLEDQTRPAATMHDKSMPTEADATARAQQAPIPMETEEAKPDQHAKTTVTPEQQQQQAPNTAVTPEQQQQQAPETPGQQQHDSKTTVTPEQQQQQDSKTTVTPEQQQQQDSKPSVTPEQQHADPKATVTPEQQQQASVKEEPTGMGKPGDEWRCDRRGRLLKPHALYMSGDVDPQVMEKRLEAEGSSSNTALSSNEEESEDTYEWWPYKYMVQEMYRYKNYAKSSDYKRKKFETSAEFECTADVEENEMGKKMMEAMMEDLKPAVANLRDAKATIAVALGQKKDEDALKGPTQVLLNALVQFKKMAEPIRSAIKKANPPAGKKTAAKAWVRRKDHDLQQALSYVPTQVLDNESEEAGKLIDVSLPMFDPHELLEWLFVNERVSIDDEEIRTYWEHFRKLGASWAQSHPASNDHVPISGDKFTALMLTFPLFRIKGSLPADPKAAQAAQAVAEPIGIQSRFAMLALRPATPRAMMANIASRYLAVPRHTFEECLLQVMPEAPCPLLLCEGWHPDTIKFCSMHVLALGVFQTLTAEAILWLCESRIFGSPQDDMDARLRSAFMGFKAWLRIQKISCSGRQFSCKSLHLSPADYPYLGYKAFNCRIVLAWCADARF